MSDEQAQPGAGYFQQLWPALLELARSAGVRVIVGLIAAGALVLAFAAVAEDVFNKESTNADIAIARAIHSVANPVLDTVARVLTDIGGVYGTAIVGILAFGFLVWRGRPHTAWLIPLAIAGGVAISELLKIVFQRPRPTLWPYADVPHPGFSFPSGHATVSLCLYGVLLWLVLHDHPRAWWAWAWSALMVLLIAGIGLSRIYLGVHYPTDIAAGYIAGTFWLVSLFAGDNVLAHMHREERALAREKTAAPSAAGKAA